MGRLSRKTRRYVRPSTAFSEVSWFVSMKSQVGTDDNKKPDEACFLQPNEWIPERFTTRPELVLNAEAFVPWSIGETPPVIQ